MGIKKKDGIDFAKRWVRRKNGLCFIHKRNDLRSELLGTRSLLVFTDLFGFEPEDGRWTAFYILKDE